MPASARAPHLQTVADSDSPTAHLFNRSKDRRHAAVRHESNKSRLDIIEKPINLRSSTYIFSMSDLIHQYTEDCFENEMHLYSLVWLVVVSDTLQLLIFRPIKCDK
jgi:hypothetical protein